MCVYEQINESKIKYFVRLIVLDERSDGRTEWMNKWTNKWTESVKVFSFGIDVCMHCLYAVMHELSNQLMGHNKLQTRRHNYKCPHHDLVIFLWISFAFSVSLTMLLYCTAPSSLPSFQHCHFIKYLLVNIHTRTHQAVSNSFHFSCISHAQLNWTWASYCISVRKYRSNKSEHWQKPVW